MSGMLEILKRESEALSRFVLVLADEQAMLRSAQAAELPAITQEKITLVEQLNQLGAERRALLPKTQASDDAAAMTEWLKSNSSNTEAAQTWQGILELAREARQMHERNGKLVSILLQKTNDALAILTQRAPEQTLYGSDGQTAAATGSRLVDSA